MNLIKSETQPAYSVPYDIATADQDETIRQAMDILTSRMVAKGSVMSNPEDVKQYLCLRFAGLEHEIFSCIFLDTRHALIQPVDMFRGTIDGASVHPREVAKEALKWNASAVILAHNHPSGEPEPSRADISLTKRLTEALALLDIRVLDHFVIGGIDTVSFAERGLI
jgi:DNA repair protein RadC